MRVILGFVIGGFIGGLVGYYQWLCSSGSECALVGSWYGGALIGGLLGIAVSGGCPLCACAGNRCRVPAGKPDGGSKQKKPDD